MKAKWVFLAFFIGIILGFSAFYMISYQNAISPGGLSKLPILSTLASLLNSSSFKGAAKYANVSNLSNALSVNGIEATIRNASFGVAPASCIPQLNGTLASLKAKLPAGSSITIVNESAFGRASNNSSVGNIETWITRWQAGLEYSGCSMASNGSAYSGGQYGYVCDDLRFAIHQNMSIGGVAIKIQPYFGGGASVSYLDPLLCGNQNLLPNSTAFLKSGALVVS